MLLEKRINDIHTAIEIISKTNYNCNRVPTKSLLFVLLIGVLVVGKMCQSINSSGNEDNDDDDETAAPSNTDHDDNSSTSSELLVHFDDDPDQEQDQDGDQNVHDDDDPQSTDDDDDEDDGEEEDDDDEDEFYNQHPVKLATNQRDLDIKLNDSDFDDHEVFKTNDFYLNSSSKTPSVSASTSSARPTKVKLKQKQKSPTNQTIDEIAGISQPSQISRRLVSSSGCALVLNRGDCITYRSLEWAINRAKNLVSYQRPSGLDSLQLGESTIGTVGQLNEMTTRLLAARYRLNFEEISRELETIDVSQTSLWRECPRLFRLPPVCRNVLSAARFRSHSGRCNNLLGAHLGSANMPFVRLQPPSYGDSVGSARLAQLSGSQLPPARLVAINLHRSELEISSEDLSVLFMSWGQLINHDLALASTARDSTGHEHNCCSKKSQQQQQQRGVDFYLTNCMPILMPPEDPIYGPFRVSCHEFKRSLAGLRPACSLGPRTQINTITSYVDGSFVYGSSSSMSASLRRARNGRGQLAMWNYFRELRPALKALLPPQVENPDEECIGRQEGQRQNRYCFRSGDSRTNQQIQLVSLHTIHARQHNRLAAGLEMLNPHWTSRRIYHEARHIHIALIQHILLAEYLPHLLGAQVCEKYQLTETHPGEWWHGYDAGLNAGISQEFAAAAFRQGHNSVPSQVFRFNPISHEPVRSYPLRQLFRQPWPLFEPGAVDEFLAGMADVPSKSLDTSMSEELSGHLLEMPGERVGLDLASINIQRGRDQGLASYNYYREWCGLKRAHTFEQLGADMNNRSWFMMSQLYETVDDIDLFTGGLSEWPLDGAQVGPTFACILARQFGLLRAGDRFWFELGPQFGAQAFSLDQLNSIKQVSLARLLCVNSDSQFDIQPEAFRLAHPILNGRQPCASLPDLDLTLWFEPTRSVPANDDYHDEDDDDDDDDDDW